MPFGPGYPCRSIRTHRWLYVRNYAPDRWPAGDPDFNSRFAGYYGDIDNGPTKTFMMEHQDDPPVKPLFELGFGKRPAEELYDLARDLQQVRNLAGDPAFDGVREYLARDLRAYQLATGDARVTGRPPWDDYPCR